MNGCNQCEAMMINMVFCHETGCPNQGRKPQRRAMLSYVAIRKTDRARVYVRTSLTPSEHYFPEYAAFIGPFKTVRGAKWAVSNPCNWANVREAEIMAKKELGAIHG